MDTQRTSREHRVHKFDLDTPALILDADVLDANVANMAPFARNTGVSVRPRCKTHKSPAIAPRQLECEGCTVMIGNPEERRHEASEVLTLLVDATELLRGNGFDVPIVGSSGTGIFDIGQRVRREMACGRPGP